MSIFTYVSYIHVSIPIYLIPKCEISASEIHTMPYFEISNILYIAFQVDLPPKETWGLIPWTLIITGYHTLYFLIISSIELIFCHWLFVISSSGCLHHIWPYLNTVAKYLFLLVVVLSQWSYSLFSMIPQSIIWFVSFEFCLCSLKTFYFLCC